MEAHTIIISIVSIAATLLGLFGWSHRSLRQRIMEMEIELSRKPDMKDARTIMSDKIAPIQVEYHALTRRIDDLKVENHKLNDKIDKLLVLCTEMVHKHESSR